MRIYIQTIACLLFLIVLNYSVFSDTRPRQKNNEFEYYVGGSFLFNRVSGSYNFKTLEKSQPIDKPGLPLSGFCFGKRRYPSSWLRVQINSMFNYGNSYEDTLYYAGTFFTSKHHYTHFAGELDAHLVRPKTTRLDLFVLCGIGINYLHRVEKTVASTNHAREISLQGYSGIDIKHWCPDVHFGAGFDFLAAKNVGLNLTYSYRIWQPVSFLDARDLPVKPIEYKELFLTHQFQFKLLFNLLSD